jgi:hypothetical protein
MPEMNHDGFRGVQRLQHRVSRELEDLRRGLDQINHPEANMPDAEWARGLYERLIARRSDWLRAIGANG